MSDTEKELLEHTQFQNASSPIGYLTNALNNPSNTPAQKIMADFTPTAGATETFTVITGDHFYDPGGPGGTTSSGPSPPNYPNCGCTTSTTLAGAIQIEFLFMSIFSDWDHLKIYDGVDNTGTLLYDNGSSGSPNYNDKNVADMISSHGSAIFNSTTGNFYFEFYATSTVGYGGWDVEVLIGGHIALFPKTYRHRASLLPLPNSVGPKPVQLPLGILNMD